MTFCGLTENSAVVVLKFCTCLRSLISVMSSYGWTNVRQHNLIGGGESVLLLLTCAGTY